VAYFKAPLSLGGRFVGLELNPGPLEYDLMCFHYGVRGTA
jgi:hypothetical protein